MLWSIVLAVPRIMLAGVLLHLALAPVARPQQCGGENLRPCSFLERLPPCNANLVERGGKCIRPSCGKEGQRPCVITERIPSCDTDLVEQGGKCMHPPCGREGQRPCVFTERIPSCDSGLIEWGTCVKKGVCGGIFQRPCVVADRPPPSCNAGLSEDFAKKECVLTKAGHSAFLDGIKSLTDEVAKGSGACEAFLLESGDVGRVDWFGRAMATLLGPPDAAFSCSRHMAIGFLCATPSQLKKVGAPVDLYNNIADAYESKTCAADVQASGWSYRPAKLLGPSTGFDCRYDSNATPDPRRRVFPRAEQFDPPFFDSIRDPVSRSHAGSCWACPKFTFRSTTHIESKDACMRGDERNPQLRAMCATFTVFADRGVKPLQCMERLIRAVVSDAGSGESGNKVCTMAGALAFDQAVDVAIGKVDPHSSAKKLADAIVKIRTALKGPAVVAKINEEVRKIAACDGLFAQ